MRRLMLVQLEKWAKNERITMSVLRKACAEIESGLIDAYLGGGVIKKRVALKGRGKSGSARTLLAYKKGKRLLVMYAFKKNQLANVSKKELAGLKEYAEVFFSLPDESIDQAVKDHRFIDLDTGEW